MGVNFITADKLGGVNKKPQSTTATPQKTPAPKVAGIFDSIDIKIIELISSGKSQNDIIKETKKGKPTIIRHLNKLQKEGAITISQHTSGKKTFTLTKLGESIVPRAETISKLSKPEKEELVKSQKEKKQETKKTKKRASRHKTGVPPHADTTEPTQTEQKYLNLMVKGIIAPQHIADLLKVDIRTAHRHIKNLRNKGLINNQNILLKPHNGAISPTDTTNTTTHRKDEIIHQIRVHGHQFRIKILEKGTHYQKVKKSAKPIIYDGNTTSCNNEVIQVYGTKIFVANIIDGDVDAAVEEAHRLSLEYYLNLFTRIENDLDIKLIKDRKTNIDLVKWKWGDPNNEIAEDYEQKGQRLQIHDKEDGKLCVDMDMSYNGIHELHFPHSEKGMQDTKNVMKIIYDIREHNDLAKISEIQQAIFDLTTSIRTLSQKIDAAQEVNTDTARGLNAVTRFLEVQLTSMQSQQSAPTTEPNDNKPSSRHNQQEDIAYA